MDIKALIEAAIAAREFSYSPYSGFCVGAAVLTKSRSIYSGCNIESASYSPTNCAERTAIFKAVSEGECGFDAIAIVGGNRDGLLELCPPCGVCRQVMAEFCNLDGFKIIIAKSVDDYVIKSLSELLPMSFGEENMAK